MGYRVKTKPIPHAACPAHDFSFRIITHLGACSQATHFVKTQAPNFPVSSLALLLISTASLPYNYLVVSSNLVSSLVTCSTV